MTFLIQLPQLSKAELNQLSLKKLSSAQISQLLNRDDLDSELADHLLAKSEFKGIIAPRNWVKTKHLHYVLSHCQDFSSFASALHHPQLSLQDREQWYNNARLQQAAFETRAKQTQKPKDKLLAYLEKLKIKTFTHALKAKTESNYMESAKTAFELERKLSALTEQLIMKRTPIIRSMLLSINEARPCLAAHRGYKQIILDILNLILAIVSFGQASKDGDWRLFKAKTDSFSLVEEIKQCIEQFNPMGQTALEMN